MGSEFNNEWFLKKCEIAKQKSEEFDDRCIILIQLFGGYSASEVLHVEVTCARNTREVLHAACKDIPFLLRGSVEVCNKKQ